MIGWLRERIEIGRLAQQRADRLAAENQMLRMLADARKEEIDRLNKVIDEVQAVVCNWKK